MSVLLAVPYGIGGIIGSKIFLILVAALLPFFGWRFSALLSTDPGIRAWSVTAVFLTASFIPASNQVYPDMIGGVICFVAIYGLMRMDQRPPLWSRLAISIAVAFLPWLHVKFAAPMLLLVAAGIFLSRRRGAFAIACEILPLIVSLALLAFYNDYAYASPLGPRGLGELSLHLPALMVLAGLYLDQNQGFLMQNPVFLIGLWSLAAFCIRFRFVGLVSVLVFLSLIVPNALEASWYGGLSFAGRFGWAGACLLAMPTIHGLIRIGERHRTAFTALIAAAGTLQIFLFTVYAAPGSFLYNRDPKTALADYSIYYRHLRMWLPAFYDPTWAFGYLPNLIFVIAAWSVFLLGTRAAFRGQKTDRPTRPQGRMSRCRPQAGLRSYFLIASQNAFSESLIVVTGMPVQ